jgi:hypothetical protein
MFGGVERDDSKRVAVLAGHQVIRFSRRGDAADNPRGALPRQQNMD